MRKIRDVLRLHHERGLGQRDIAAGCAIARSTVAEYLRRAQHVGLEWPLPEGVDDLELGRRLFPATTASPEPRTQPDFQYLRNELSSHKNVNLTLAQLWQEYREQHSDGYQYSRFCDLYRRWLGKRDYSMRQDHRAGEKLFVDYCGGLPLVDLATGELIKTQLFVGVWGASNFTYAEASLSQELPAWIGAHTRAFEYFGCVPHLLVPDNLKSGVQKACLYEPQINATYAEMTDHYGCAVLPARPRRPRDKAKAEAGVLIVQRWILAVLRHRIFSSLAELNAAIRGLLERLNTRPLRKLQQSRRELFEAMDRPAALPLPDRPYEYAEWSKATVNIDYHVEVAEHYYSVPCRLLHERLDIRLTAGAVEIFQGGQRVAAHERCPLRYKHTTLPEHMPVEHRKYAEWTPSRIIQWATQTGPATASLVERVMAAKAHPEQGYRACLGILRLGERFGKDRVEAASRRGLHYNTCSFRSIKSILIAGLDRQAPPQEQMQTALPFHDNIRGGQYYH